MDLRSGRMTDRRSYRRNRFTRDADRRRKGPLILRILAWSGVALLFFSLGYVSSGWLLNYLDGKGIGGQPDVVSTQDQAKGLMTSSGQDVQTLVDMGRRVAFSIYIPNGKGGVDKEEVTLVSSIMEDDAAKVISVLLSKLSKKKIFASDVAMKHVFRDGELVYLNFNEAFYIALSKLSQSEGAVIMTGIVRSIVDNFMPVTKVQFLIDGKVREAAGSIPLSVPWELKNRG